VLVRFLGRIAERAADLMVEDIPTKRHPPTMRFAFSLTTFMSSPSL
jgi:hypothetical protein